MQIQGFDRSTTQQACIKHTHTFLPLLLRTVTTALEHQQEICSDLMVRNICLRTEMILDVSQMKNEQMLTAA